MVYWVIFCEIDDYLPAITKLRELSAMIYVGFSRLLVRDIDHRVHAIGSNDCGQCGSVLVDNEQSNKLTAIQGSADSEFTTNNHNRNHVTLLSSGSFACHTFVITETDEDENENEDQKIYSFGAHDYGQTAWGSREFLGQHQRNTGPRLLPDSVMNIFHRSRSRITQIGGGYDHTLFLTDDGIVYGCGSNCSSQLGLPLPLDQSQTRDNQTRDNQNNLLLLPVRIPIPDSVVIIHLAVGDKHNLLTTSECDLYAFGNNEYQGVRIYKPPLSNTFFEL